MRILYVSDNSAWGGACAALVRLLEEIKDKHELFVFMPSPNGRLSYELDRIGIKYRQSVTYSDTIYPHYSNPLKYLYHLLLMYVKLSTARRDFKRYVLEIKPDIVHCNVGPLGISSGICKRNRIPHVWHLREYQDLDFNMNFFPSRHVFLRRIHADGNYCIAITKGVFHHFNLREGTDVIIYDGVFKRSALPAYNPTLKKEPYFLFVGRESEAKGTHLILNPLRRIIEKYPAFKLKIVGEVYEHNQYHHLIIDLIKKYNLLSHVEYLGHRTDVYELMSKATALIVPSRFEGFGFITAEAMANYCLVIGKNTAGTKEQFDNGLSDLGNEIGLRFMDETGLYECMLRAIENDMQEYIIRARKVVESRYTSDLNSNEVLRLYERITKDS